MKPLAVATVVVRGVALWVFIQAVAGLGTLLQDWLPYEGAKRAQLAVVLVATVLPVATALLVWANADWLAVRLLGGGSQDGGVDPWASGELLRLAVAIVGFCILADAVTQLVWYASIFVSLNTSRSGILGTLSPSADLKAQFWQVSGKANFISTVARTIIGFVFVLKPAMVVSYVGRYDHRTQAEPDAGSDEAVQQGDEADER